jgi:hypothetical protein
MPSLHLIEDLARSSQDKCREPDVPRRRLQLPVPSFTEFESGILRQPRDFRIANRDPGTGGEHLRKEPISIEVVCRERYPHLD